MNPKNEIQEQQQILCLGIFFSESNWSDEEYFKNYVQKKLTL
jgi:hypothetical protein